MSYYDGPEFKNMSLKDVGTREQHCMELLEIWEAGLEIIGRRMPGLKTKRDEHNESLLKGAVELLQAHLLSTADGFREVYYLREINSVKTGEVKDGQS